MQATARTHDAATRSGTLLLDDGTEVRYDAATFDRSGLRLLRMGQRVTVVLDGSQVGRIEFPAE